MKTQQDRNNIRHFVGAVVLCVSFIGAVAGSIAIAEPDADTKEETFNWYRKAAEQGDAAAQYNLGLCYCNGWGVSKDMTEAVEWYRKAAEQGNAPAQEKLKELGF